MLNTYFRFYYKYTDYSVGFLSRCIQTMLTSSIEDNNKKTIEIENNAEKQKELNKYIHDLLFNIDELKNKQVDPTILDKLEIENKQLKDQLDVLNSELIYWKEPQRVLSTNTDINTTVTSALRNQSFSGKLCCYNDI